MRKEARMGSIMDEIVKDILALALKTEDPATGRKTSGEAGAPLKSGEAREPASYGWHDPRLPPELRKAHLRGEKYEADARSGLYTVMAVWYERVSGQRAPGSFQLYRDWKRAIRSGSGLCGSLGAEERERLILAVEAGTRWRREDRDPAKILDILKKTAI